MQVCAKKYGPHILRTIEAIGLFKATKTHDQFRFCKDGCGCHVKKSLESSEGCERPFRRPLPSFWQKVIEVRTLRTVEDSENSGVNRYLGAKLPGLRNGWIRA